MSPQGAPYMQDPAGPIQRLEWAMFTIRGQRHGWDDEADQVVGVGKDIRIRGDTVSAWKERHGHRLDIKMVTGVWDPAPHTLIVGVGVYSRLKVPKRVARAIQERGVARLIVEPTPQACQTYNALVREGHDVALLAHGTC